MDLNGTLTPEQIAALGALLDSAKTGVPAPGQQTAAATPPGAVAAPPTPSASAEPLEFDWGGQHFVARDNAELQRILDQAQQAKQSEIDAAASRQLAESQRSQAQRQSLTAPDPNSFSKEKYAELFLQDPRLANNYADAHDPNKMRAWVEVGRAIEDVRTQVGASRDEQAALAFMSANPDWKQSEENLAKLSHAMQELGHDKWNTSTMTSAFKYAKATGMIGKDDGDDGYGPADPDARNMTPRLVAPPRTRRGKTASADEAVLAGYYDLTPEKQKQYLESLTA